MMTVPGGVCFRPGSMRAGKGVVNSISLKEGEGPFLEQARHIRDHGAG